MGLGIGIALERKCLGFESEGTLSQKSFRFFLGAAMLIAVYGGFKYAFSSMGFEPLFRFLRYLIIGFWIAFVSPWIFLKLRLAGKGTGAIMDQGNCLKG
jgi:hypothetical protein